MRYLLFILWLPVYGVAQQPSLYFEKLTVANGLSHNKVNCILQDRRGFIWLGTDDGLNRYDGKRITRFRSMPGDTTSLSGNIITDMLEDKEGLLWIATADGGLSRYDCRLPPKQQFRRYNQINGDGEPGPVVAINALLEDKTGHLWLGTSGKSVLRFEKAGARIAQVIGGAKTILDLCLDKDGVVWVGKQGGGISKIHSSTLAITEDQRYRNLYAKLPHVTVTSLFRDQSDKIWFGSWDKVLYCYDPRSGKEAVVQNGEGTTFQNDEILSFAEDRSGRLWIGGKEKGLQLLDRQTGKFYHYANNPHLDGTIADNRINCIFIDRHGSVWLGTNQGVSINNPQKQTFRQQFLPSTEEKPITVYEFFEHPDGELWMGTSEGLFIRKEDGSLEQRRLFYKGNPLHITSFFTSDDGTLFLGTNYSLFRYYPEKGSVSLLPNTERDGVMNRLISSRVVSAVSRKIDGRPAILVSPYGHFLAYYDLEKKRWVSRLDSSNIIRRFGISDNLIRTFYKTSNGAVLLATAKRGVGVWMPDSEKITYLQYDPVGRHSITSNNVFDITEANPGTYWVSPYGGGLHLYDMRAGTFEHIPQSNNLVEGIGIDRHGRVWMISNGHLQLYDPTRRTLTNYQLPDVEKTGGVRGKIFSDRRGRLYMAGTGYFISFDPDSVKDAGAEPEVVFSDFQIFNQSFSHLLWEDRITLQYGQNYFGFEFAAPYFSPGRELRFSYKLEGFDKDWVDAGERNYVNYSNLHGGDYVFKVRVSHTPGSWSKQMAAVPLTIIPPFWERAWFFGLCALFLGGAGYLIYRFRINELLKRQAIRNKIAQDLHDNVGSTLSSISVYSQVAKIYQQTEKTTDLRNTLEKISSTSTEMISELNDTVWVINPRNDNMEGLLQRMESFARPLMAVQGIQFEFHYDPTLSFLQLPMEKRKSLYAIFKEAVNNAVKYAECKQLSVSLLYKGNKVSMIITDDGKGFEFSKTSEGYKSSDVFGGGNGLRNMYRRATEMKGTLLMKSEPGKGTTLQLQFPIP